MIPRNIWQTFKTSSLPERMGRATASWREQNPGWKYRFFVDEECRDFLLGVDLSLVMAYDRLPPGAFRADLWRYAVLHEHGGAYADVDTVCMYALDRLLGPSDQFVVAHDANPIRLFNAFLCVLPRHKVLSRVLENIIVAVGKHDFVPDPTLLYDLTGPGGLALAATEVLGLPLKCAFRPGHYQRGELTLRVLRKLHWKWHASRRVMLGLRTVCLCKYPGYLEDLATLGGKHWKA